MQTANENRPSTRKRIEKAIRDMSDAGCKITISGVAKEAGVSNATIHNRYPDLASQIRELVSKATELDARRVRPKWKGKIKTPKQQRQALRDELADSKEKLAKVYSVNFSLDQENQSLKAENEALKSQLAEALNRNRSGNNKRNRWR